MNFIHIGFLAAGAAAMTLPLWIHLLLRQRATSMNIGSIRFVKQVVQRTRNRQRIRRWLLLALRALAVFLLGMLFARPFLPSTPVDGRTREVALLIDRSASMTATHEDGTTTMQRAVKRAQEYVESLGEQTVVHVGLFDSAGVQPVSLDELKSVSVSSLGTRFDDAFDWASDVLAESDRSDRSLFLLSDLQRQGTRNANLKSFPPDVPVRIEDPAPAVSQNVAIESVYASQAEIRLGVPVVVQIQVVNHGAFPAIDAKVNLNLEGPAGAINIDRPLSMTAGERQTIQIDLPIDKEGIYQGRARLDREDPMMWDNERPIAFMARPPDRLLLIDGDAGEKAWENETYFVEAALRLQTAVGVGPARTFEVQRMVWDRGRGFPDLTGYRLIVMANIGRFDQRDATRLKSFVASGGNVILFAGERSTKAVYDRFLESGVLGTTTIGSAMDTFARVVDFDASHPALTPFSDPQHGDLRSLAASRLVPLESIDPACDVLMRSRKWPLLVSHQLGDGRCVLVTTSADRSWNDWPRNRLFVPLVRQLAAWMTGQLDARQNVVAKTIDRPNQTPGIERADNTLIVRSIDPQESQIGRFSVEQFREAVGLPEQSLVTAESDRREQLAPEGALRPDEKWPLLVWTLIGVLACELILASRVHE
ncbi:MAG: BatA domain-containing protein [Planctomycetales bacterium]|nr:BatA domain-containing protein [Planctomycetales bacterium]